MEKFKPIKIAFVFSICIYFLPQNEGPNSLIVTVWIRTLKIMLQNAKSCIVNIESLYSRIVSNDIPCLQGVYQHLAHSQCKYTNAYIEAWY